MLFTSRRSHTLALVATSIFLTFHSNLTLQFVSLAPLLLWIAHYLLLASYLMYLAFSAHLVLEPTPLAILHRPDMQLLIVLELYLPGTSLIIISPYVL